MRTLTPIFKYEDCRPNEDYLGFKNGNITVLRYNPEGELNSQGNTFVIDFFDDKCIYLVEDEDFISNFDTVYNYLLVAPAHIVSALLKLHNIDLTIETINDKTIGIVKILKETIGVVPLKYRGKI